jgi:fructan beta-fructosidase
MRMAFLKIAAGCSFCSFLFAIFLALFIPFRLRAQDGYDEPWRPQFHFTPPKNFMNDPNGLVFYKGEYHLFYQYNPQGTQWGHMSWGHAVSADMLHWKNLPVAMPEQPDYMIYSGSAAVDWHNSSGLCRGEGRAEPSCLVAIYTAAGKDWQRQNLMFSNDRGRTWTNFDGNPVADLQLPDFRDPKIFWYEPQQKWVMVAVAADEKKAVILDSRDLKKWTLQSYFQAGNKEKGQWECPDLFELNIDGEPGRKKWVLVVNRNPGAPAGGTGTEYFVGSFDGRTFVSEDPKNEELWADYGKDFYATNSFSDLPTSDGGRIWMGWISNWQYANREPTEAWRGAQSLPRELALKRYADGLRLVQSPIREAVKLRERQLFKIEDVPITKAREALQRQNVHGTTIEIEAEFAPGRAKEIGMRLRKGAGEETILGFASATKEVFVDRSKSGVINFSPDFSGRQQARERESARVKLPVLVDRSSLEIFGNDGEVVLTDRIYPSLGSAGFELYSNGSGGGVVSLSIWQLSSVWQ